jgi:Gas vesicle synthesis protein GvpL/GvpF
MSAPVAEYVYGVVPATAGAPDGVGISGAPVRLIEGPQAAALVSDFQGDELRLGREAVLAHTRVLDEALARGPVLPMRFGLLMEGPDEVRTRLLVERGPELAEELERLAGKVEIRVHAMYEQKALLREVVSEEPEIADLRARTASLPEDATYYDRIRLGELVAAAIDAKREVDREWLLARLAPVALDVDVAPEAHERTILSASFLVERAEMAQFDAVLDELAAAQAERMRFKSAGPLPPHSFVTLEGAI